MNNSPSAWTAPAPVGGPAAGIEFASHGARLVGYIIDIVVQGALFIGILGITFVAGAVFRPLFFVGVLAWLALSVGYFPYFWSKNGQTPGMKLMRIKVVRDADGGPVSVGQAILRLVGYWVSGVVFYIGYIWIFVDRRRRGWMDLIAGTVVVSVPSDPIR